MFLPGVSVSGPMFLPGGSLVSGPMFLLGGLCPGRGLPDRDPLPWTETPLDTDSPTCTVKSGRYGSYWNAFLLQCNFNGTRAFKLFSQIAHMLMSLRFRFETFVTEMNKFLPYSVCEPYSWKVCTAAFEQLNYNRF